eukprot:Filipodium_phascolosomae@DN2370_c0_g1_i1.p1
MRPPKGSVSSIVSILPSYRSALCKTTSPGFFSDGYNGDAGFFMTPTKLSFPLPLHTKKADIRTQTVFANAIARSPSSMIISDIASNSNGNSNSKVKHIVDQVQLEIAAPNFQSGISIDNLNYGNSNELLEYLCGNPNNRHGREAAKDRLKKQKESVRDEGKAAKEKHKRVQKSVAGSR